MQYIISTQHLIEATDAEAAMAASSDIEDATLVSISITPHMGAGPVLEVKPARKKRASRKKPGDGVGTKNADEPPVATDVQMALKNVLADESLGPDSARALLKQYGASNVSQLAEGDYAAIIEAANALL